MEWGPLLPGPGWARGSGALGHFAVNARRRASERLEAPGLARGSFSCTDSPSGFPLTVALGSVLQKGIQGPSGPQDAAVLTVHTDPLFLTKGTSVEPTKAEEIIRDLVFHLLLLHSYFTTYTLPPYFLRQMFS